MSEVRVWLRPLGNVFRVRVDSFEGAKWLLGRLRQTVVNITSVPIAKFERTSDCTFEVPYDSKLSRSGFEKLLATIPEVKLMTGPECETSAQQMGLRASRTGG